MAEQNRRGKLILTSRGLNTRIGTSLIGTELEKDDLQGKRMLLVSVPGYEVDDILVNSCIELGFEEKNIVLSRDFTGQEQHFDYIYCTEGNTFEVVEHMRQKNLWNFVRRCVYEGATYIGASAGAIIAGDDFELANDFDSNYMRMRDYTGLMLFSGTIIPHYEPEELERYIANTEEYRLKRYEKMYSVGNEEVVVMEGE